MAELEFVRASFAQSLQHAAAPALPIWADLAYRLARGADTRFVAASLGRSISLL